MTPEPPPRDTHPARLGAGGPARLADRLAEWVPRPGDPGPELSPEERRASVARLVLIVAAGLALAAVTGKLAVVGVIAAVLVMILLHEAGHLVTARWAGMKVTEYFVGFGPRLWSVRRGETTYGVKALPLGGYVRIVGMNSLDRVDPADEPRSYRAQPYRWRLAVASAGSAVHFIVAFVLLWVVFAVVGVPTDAGPLKVGSITRSIAGRPSPAVEAGFRLGDEIVAVDGRAVARWDDVVRYIRARPGRPVTVTVERDGVRRDLVVVPLDLAALPAAERPVEATRPTGFVGVGFDPPLRTTGPVAALGRSADRVRFLAVEAVKGIGMVFSPNGLSRYLDQLTEKPGPARPSEDQPRFLSPKGLVDVAGSAARNGWLEVLSLLIAINVFVGVFNMIPLPPLDGGLVALATYEKVRSLLSGRDYRADYRKVLPVAAAVIMVLVFLGLTSLYLDIVRPLDLRQ